VEEFLAKSPAAAPEVPLTTIFWGIWPFPIAALLLLAIVIITAFPQIALFILSLMWEVKQK
jgi:TRAP-type mannitol/chloroaromatic compound transport system permease large subunit